MSSPTGVPDEKHLASPLTSHSNASSSTYRSYISLKSLRHVASSFGLLPSQTKSDDVEKQSTTVAVQPDASAVAVDDPVNYETKVRTRKCDSRMGFLWILTAILPSRGMSNWILTLGCFQLERTKFHAISRLQHHSCTLTTEFANMYTTARS